MNVRVCVGGGMRGGGVRGSVLLLACFSVSESLVCFDYVYLLCLGVFCFCFILLLGYVLQFREIVHKLIHYA